MGVRDLWSLLSPSAELLNLNSLNGKIVAVDLSCWICDSQNVNMGGNVVRPHLRNLFFRCMRLIQAGILPIFVLEGKAPELKWNTIQSRIASRTKSKEGCDKLKENNGNRSRLKGLIKQCRELLGLLGIPWVQAEGEAEATCAALCYHNITDGVITQDSDVFLYGANIVFRNFSANANKSTVDQFKLHDIEANLGLNRESLICLSILLGCDYLPQGVPGVGCKVGLQLIREWTEKGVSNYLERIRQWKNMKDELSSLGRNRSKLTIEESVRKKAIAVEGFPFEPVIGEFMKKLPKPNVQVCWLKPKLAELVMWCSVMLDWPPDYSVTKVASVVSLWTLLHPGSKECLQLRPLSIVKRCVRQGVPSFDVEWKINDECLKKILQQNPVIEDGLLIVDPSIIKTTEVAAFVQKSFPNLVEVFEEGKKKGKKKRVRNTKAKNIANSKESILNYVYVKDDENMSEEDSNISFAIDRLLKLKIMPQEDPDQFSQEYTAGVSLGKLCRASSVQELSFDDEKNVKTREKVDISVIDLSSDSGSEDYIAPLKRAGNEYCNLSAELWMALPDVLDVQDATDTATESNVDKVARVPDICFSGLEDFYFKETKGEINSLCVSTTKQSCLFGINNNDCLDDTGQSENCASGANLLSFADQKATDFNESLDLFDYSYCAIDCNEMNKNQGNDPPNFNESVCVEHTNNNKPLINVVKEDMGITVDRSFTSENNSHITKNVQQSNIMPCFQLVDSFSNLTLCLDDQNVNNESHIEDSLSALSEVNKIQAQSKLKHDKYSNNTYSMEKGTHGTLSNDISVSEMSSLTTYSEKRISLESSKSVGRNPCYQLVDDQFKLVHSNPCFQLVDDINNLTLCMGNEMTIYKQPRNSPNKNYAKSQHTISTGRNNLCTKPFSKMNANDVQTPIKSLNEEIKSCFVTPEIESRSLLERLRRKHGDKALNVLDL